MERILALKPEIFRLAVDDAFNHVIITDTSGVILYANKAAELMTGYTFEEMRGNTPRLWGRQMGQVFYEKMWHLIKVEKKSFRGYIKNRNKSKEFYYAMATISPIIEDDTGILIGFVGTEVDMTKEQSVSKMKDEFLAVASHELRTPLTAIDGIVSMMLEGDYGEVNENLIVPLKDVNTASQRLIHLVNDLLNLSKIQSNKMIYRWSKFKFLPVLDEILTILSTVASKKNIYLQSHVELDVELDADVDKVKEILNNLIGNAIKFTEFGGVDIYANVVNDHLIIYVKDSGLGMDDKDKQKLFGKFQQLSNSYNKPQGTGLGLYISREMARLMGGEVWLTKGEKGVGSEFAFSIPLSNTETSFLRNEIVQVELNKLEAF